MISKIHKAGEIPAYTSEAIFADLIGRDRRGIERLRGQGVLPKKEEEGVPLKASIQAFVDYVENSDHGRPTDRLNIAKAKLAEFDLAVKQGQYILTEEVRAANIQIYSAFADCIKQWSDRLPQMIIPNPEGDEQDVCAEIVEQAGRDLLAELSTFISEKFKHDLG